MKPSEITELRLVMRERLREMVHARRPASHAPFGADMPELRTLALCIIADRLCDLAASADTIATDK